MSAKLADNETSQELVRSRNIQLKAIVARFGGDLNAAIDYCREVGTEEYRGYRYELATEQFMTAGAR